MKYIIIIFTVALLLGACGETVETERVGKPDTITISKPERQPISKPADIERSQSPKPVEAQKPVEKPVAVPTAKETTSISEPVRIESRKPEAMSSPSATPTSKKSTGWGTTKPSVPLPEKVGPSTWPTRTPKPSPSPSDEPSSDVYAWLDSASAHSEAGLGGFYVEWTGKTAYVDIRVSDGQTARNYGQAAWFNAAPGDYTITLTPYSEEGYGGIDWVVTVTVPE